MAYLSSRHYILTLWLVVQNRVSKYTSVTPIDKQRCGCCACNSYGSSALPPFKRELLKQFMQGPALQTTQLCSFPCDMNFESLDLHARYVFH